MKYFWTLFWAFALVQMLTYVASSMNGVPYNFVTGCILTVVATILIIALTALIPNEPNRNEGAH